MKDTERYIAVDFGSSEIRTLMAEMQEDNSLHILAYESRNPSDVRFGIIDQSSGVAFKTSQMIKLMCNTAKVNHKKAYFYTAINARGMKIYEEEFVYSLRKTEIITEQIVKKMTQAFKEDFEEIDRSVFTLIPLAYEVNGKEMESPVGVSANKIKGYYRVVAGGGKINLNLGKAVERMPENQLEASPFAGMEAVAVAVTDESEREEGCAVLNLGAETTTLVVYKDGVAVDMKLVPLGGSVISNDISEFGIDLKYSEKLKCLKGVAHEDFLEDPINIKVPPKDPNDKPVVLSTKFLAEMIGARLEEILQPAFEMLEMYKEDLPHGIFLTGGGSRMGKIKEFVEEKTGLSTRYGDHSAWLSDGTAEEFLDTEYSQLIGTILLAFDYRQAHLAELVKTPVGAKKKSDGPKITDKLAQGFIKFFEDDQELQE